MAKYTYYYEELPMPYIEKVMKALEKRMENGSAELTLKNGMEILVGRRPNGDIQVYDDEPNLIAEFDNGPSGTGGICLSKRKRPQRADQAAILPTR